MCCEGDHGYGQGLSVPKVLVLMKSAILSTLLGVQNSWSSHKPPTVDKRKLIQGCFPSTYRFPFAEMSYSDPKNMTRK